MLDGLLEVGGRPPELAPTDVNKREEPASARDPEVVADSLEPIERSLRLLECGTEIDRLRLVQNPVRQQRDPGSQVNGFLSGRRGSFDRLGEGCLGLRQTEQAPLSRRWFRERV